ncbi:MAG: lytic transglycosylase domain-containing protein [Nocardioides sp.]
MSARHAATTGILLPLLMVVGCSGDDVRRSPGPAQEVTSGRTATSRPSEPASRDPLAAAPAEAPRTPTTPSGAARALLAADRAIQEPTTAEALLAAAGHAQQLALRALAERPRWDEHVARQLPSGLRAATAKSVAARREFRSMHPADGDLATELPAWRIVAPLPAEELRRYYREAERRFGVPWEYLAAINLVETGFGRIEGTSVAGAQGPMQFIPTTWDMYGEGGDIHDPHDAILAAARLLRGNGFPTDPAGALYRYNNSTAYVRGVTLYAQVMQQRPRAYLGYHQWQIYYLTRAGSIWLPEGYAQSKPVPVRRWLAQPR